MQTPISSSNRKADILLGHHSDGTSAILDLTTNAPLFITHPDKKRWRALIADVGAALRERTDIHWLLCLDQNSLAPWRSETNDHSSVDSFIIDDPGSGTLTSRKDFVKAMMKVFKKRSASSKKKNRTIHICIIDDIWELIQKTERPYARQIALILQESHQSPLHILAGSSAGHRTLFPQLLMNRQGTTTHHTRQEPSLPSPETFPGTELILGTEGLIFRSSPGGNVWEKWYAPIHWIPSQDPSQSLALSGEAPSFEATSRPQISPEPLPENAQLFFLDV